MKNFNRIPKFVMYYLFPVDSVLRDKKATAETIDRSNLCLPKNDEVTKRMLHLFHPIPANEIIADLQEMGLNGLACVGVDGTCLAPEEIKSKRYGELIKKCQETEIIFIHGFPFADTYDNSLTKRYPHVRQKTYQGKHPYVGWDEVNGHPAIDYGSKEFIDFCKESIDVLKTLRVKVVDYAEPDHYPWPDNGYGESLVQAWKEETEKEPPYPTNLKHRKFMEDRNLKGVKAIGDYAKSMGMVDHLTASPLMHGGILICQNFGKYSRSDINELSTTYHAHYSWQVISLAKDHLDMWLPESRADSIGCVESKSMRGWDERHAIYIGCGQGLPLERMEEALNGAVLLHQMDLFFWDYGNFKNQSMYSYNKFDNPKNKYRQFKKMVRSTIDTYFNLPEEYRNAVVTPDALILYSKETDYLWNLNQKKEYDKLSGQYSLYAIAFKLQYSDIPFMFAYDEYPEVLAKDGKDIPLLIIDGYQHPSADFVSTVPHWFSNGKAVLFSGELAGKSKDLMEHLSNKILTSQDFKAITVDEFRDGCYSKSQSSLNLDGWREFLTWGGKSIVYIKGNVDDGILMYSTIPSSRLYQIDLQNICQNVLHSMGKQPEKFSGTMEREMVRYRKGFKKYLGIKNHGSTTETLSIATRKRSTAYYPRDSETFLTETDGEYKLELTFKPHEVRIIEYP